MEDGLGSVVMDGVVDGVFVVTIALEFVAVTEVVVVFGTSCVTGLFLSFCFSFFCSTPCSFETNCGNGAFARPNNGSGILDVNRLCRRVQRR